MVFIGIGFDNKTMAIKHLTCDGRRISRSNCKQGEGLAFGKPIGMITGKMSLGKRETAGFKTGYGEEGNMVKMTGRNGPQICRTGITTLTRNGIMQRNWSDDRLC